VLGLGFGYSPLPSLNLELRADYFHEFADAEASLTARSKTAPLSFTTDSQNMGRESTRFGAGLSWKASDMMRFGLEYDFTAANRYTGHDLMATFRLEF
jgi:outer membrane autotransporter barrel domain